MSSGLANLFEAAAALADLESGTSEKASKSLKPTKNQQVIVSDEEGPKKSPRTAPTKKEIFPQRLMDMLNDPTVSDIITWLPHGLAFVIIRPDLFTDRVLPKYLPPADVRSSTKYPSFTRKLNRWGFRQATRGPDTGAFHHPLFRRDDPALCSGMVCQRSRDRKDSEPILNHQRPQSLQVKQNSLAGVGNLSTEDSFNGSSTAVSVSDGDRSETSSDSATSNGSSHSKLLPGISSDGAFVSKVLQDRDEQERAKAARSLLYQSYIDAVSRSK